MTIGNELWTLTRALSEFHQSGEEVVIPSWAYQHYFSVPDDFFSDSATTLVAPPLQPAVFGEIAETLKAYLQPSQEALRHLMTYEGFWKLEPPVLAVHVSPNLPDDYYALAIKHFKYQSIVVFNDDPDEEDLESDIYYFQGDEPWVVPHMMSFCDYHVTSDLADSWWGAFLSDDKEAIFPLPNENQIFPNTWRGIDCADFHPESSE